MSDNRVVCAECSRELMPSPATPKPEAFKRADSVVISWLLLALRQFTYTPYQAEHLMVMLRGNTR